MNVFKSIWRKLAGSKEYREEFAATQAKRAIPAQIRALIAKKNMSQEELARASGLTQGVISRAANPNYGNLTLNTIIRIAAGFDVAFIGQFVPFSELGRWYENWSEDKLADVPSFTEEEAYLSEIAQPLEKLAAQSQSSGSFFPITNAPSQERNLSSNLMIVFRNPKPIQKNLFETPPPQLAAFDGDRPIKVEQVNAKAMASQGVPSQWQMTK